MIHVIYPTAKPKLKRDGERELIFCMIRKKWLIVTPEEWVRQNFLLYLIEMLSYPASLIAVEKTISVGELKKRFDIVVYQNAEPWMLIECKEQAVVLNPETLLQALRYQIIVSAKYIVLTNGNMTRAFVMTGFQCTEVSQIPSL